MNKYFLILILGIIGLSSCQKEQEDLVDGNLSRFGFKADNNKCAACGGSLYTLEIFESTGTINALILEDDLPNKIKLDHDDLSIDIRLEYNMITPATTKEDYAQIELLRIEKR